MLVRSCKMPCVDDKINPIVITTRPWTMSEFDATESMSSEFFFGVVTNVQMIIPSVMVATEIYFDLENCLFKMSLDSNKLVTNEPARNTI